MMEKITWYKEVLELEPASRVFFPLAKLLLSEGENKEAVETLRHGLARHPDHIEARLLLVELLAALGNNEDISLELDALGDLFGKYPSFWKIWSKHLARSPERKDAALALVFFAASLSEKNLSWSSIIENGLEKLITNEEGFDVFSEISRAGESGKMPGLAKSGMAKAGLAMAGLESLDEAKKSSLDYLKASAHGYSKGSGQDYSKASGHGQDSEADEAELGADEPDELEEDYESLSDGSVPDESVPDESVPDESEFSPFFSSSNIMQSKAGFEAKEAVRKLPPANLEIPDDNDDETFSLRTRSMAEVLAEQGDFAGALDILEEVLSIASEGDKSSIKERIRELSEQAGLVSSSTALSKDKDLSSGAEKVEGNKLLSVLESLALRFEDRAG